MILLSLNIRGVGGPLKLASMRRLLEKSLPTIIFLQETLVDASTARDFMHLLRPNWMTCAASSVGNSGGLLASWDPSLFDFFPMLSPGGILLSGTCFELNPISTCSMSTALVLTVKFSGNVLMISGFWPLRISSLQVISI
jgi:hypothetical protein